MSVTYTKADADVMAVVQAMRDRYHEFLRQADVRIGVLMAANENGDAVTHGGYPALAKIKIVPLRDRITKGFDAEIHIDQSRWDSFSDERKAAVIDHELSHITTKLNADPESELSWAVDDIGRPKLSSVKGDWNVGDGFAAVVARHGSEAVEFENIRIAKESADMAMDAGKEMER